MQIIIRAGLAYTTPEKESNTELARRPVIRLVIRSTEPSETP